MSPFIVKSLLGSSLLTFQKKFEKKTLISKLAKWKLIIFFHKIKYGCKTIGGVLSMYVEFAHTRIWSWVFNVKL
jgi:hypothetical protein